MKGNDLGLMLDYLDGNLGAEEALDLRARLDTDLRLADELSRIARVVDCLRTTAGSRFAPGFPERVSNRLAVLDETRAAVRGHGFAPGFADRVMTRVEPEMAADRRALAPSREVELAIPRAFTRLLPAAAAVVILLGAFSLRASGDDQTAFEAMLGLEPVTLESAYVVSTIGSGGAP